MAPSISALVDHGDIEARAVGQLGTFEAGVMFARAEGIIPAPESSHAIRVAIDEALAAKRDGVKKVIAFNLSGHGHFDMTAYADYMAGKLQDYAYPAELVQAAEQRDAATVGRIAHRVAGSSLSFGAVRLGESCREIERLTGTDDWDAIGQLVATMQDAAAVVAAACRQAVEAAQATEPEAQESTS